MLWCDELRVAVAGGCVAMVDVRICRRMVLWRYLGVFSCLLWLFGNELSGFESRCEMKLVGGVGWDIFNLLIFT